MSSRAEACRKKALECERAAQVASNPSASRVYLDLATRWRKMADEAEALQRRLASLPNAKDPESACEVAKFRPGKIRDF